MVKQCKLGKHVIEMPLPTFCPDCRNQRRQNKIYHPDAWYSDKWDAMDIGNSLT